MKKKDIQVNGRYIARVSGKTTTVVVKDIKSHSAPFGSSGRGSTHYVCRNEATGRTCVFRSAQKFIRPVQAADERSAKPSLKQKLTEQKEAMEKAACHLVVEALAGTGKTFTMIVGVVAALAPSLWDAFVDRMRELSGDPELEIVPSDEQQRVWDHLSQYKDVSHVTYCAFNRSIVSEFAEKWGWLVEMLAGAGVILKFATVNSLGNQAVYRAYGRVRVTDYHTQNLIEEATGHTCRDLRENDPMLLSATDRLVGLCKLTLAGWDERYGFDPDSVTGDVLDELVAHFDIDLNGCRSRVYDLVPKILRRSLDVDRNKEMDFNDQNWLPIVKDLPIPRCDLIAVDEGQDLPRCKQEFVRRAGRHVIVVGDANQAIYGFAGADTESIPRMRQLLNADTLRLTETRRCGKAIVAEANNILRQLGDAVFTAHESNCDGLVHSLTKQKYTADVADGDMVLSRVNAPLVSQALRFIKDGRKAIIRGREFGTELINFVKRLNATDVSSLLEKTDDWYNRESAKESRKKNPSEAKMIAMDDRRDCIQALADDAQDVQDVIAKVERIFAGKVCPGCGRHYDEKTERCFNRDCKTEKDPISGYPCGPRLVTPKGILFSSVHRAKGLEADRVFLLLCDGSAFPHPMAKTAWQRTQEYNLKYVAVTRAIRELVYVNKG